MRFSRFIPIVATTLALGLGHAPAALADAAADKALAATETAMNRANSLHIEYEAKTAETGQAERTSGLNVWTKGEKQLVEFTAPADLKGTKGLVLSPTEIYVYLPSFGKVRRITRNAFDQTAFGLAFSQSDLATQKYAGQYTPSVSSSSAKEVKLTLIPKSGQVTSFSKIEMTITKDKNVPTEIKYYNAESKLVKTETRSGYTCDSNVCTPGTLKMVNHTESLTTTLTRKKVTVNEPISDETFSKRNLEN